MALKLISFRVNSPQLAANNLFNLEKLLIPRSLLRGSSLFACSGCSDKVDKHFEMVAEKGRALLREAAERVL